MSEHEGMLTRREVLEKIAQTNRAMVMIGHSSSAAWWHGYMTGLAVVAQISGHWWVDAAHELALLIDAERSGEPCDTRD